MATNGLSSALTLYDSRTLTLPQAAKRAGLSESAFVRQLERRGIEVPDAERPAASTGDRTVHAD